MNLLCRICRNRLKPDEDVVVVNCGHLFHVSCLLVWFQRFTWCPKCRTPCVAKSLTRVYFSLDHSVSTEDATSLRDELDKMALQMRQKDSKIRKLQELAIKLGQAQQKINFMGKEIESFKRKLRLSTERENDLRERLKLSRNTERAARKGAEHELAKACKELRILRMQVAHDPDTADISVQTDNSAPIAEPGQQFPLSDVTNFRSGNTATSFSPSLVKKFSILRGRPRLENGTTKPPPGRVFDGMGGTMPIPMERSMTVKKEVSHKVVRKQRVSVPENQRKLNEFFFISKV